MWESKTQEVERSFIGETLVEGNNW